MSADLKNKKRKSGDDFESSAKKAKTTTKTAEKSAPLKSALKKTKAASTVAVAEKPAKSSAKSDSTKAKASKKEEKKTSKSSKKETVVEPAAAPEEVEDDGNTTLTADQTAALLAGFSSDEEEDEEDAGLDIASLPAPPTAEGGKKKRSKKEASGENDPETTPGTLYIGRLPHGFFERQMRAYFSQFGNIKNLRLARNKRTGKSQHHAFIEFNSASVADIVAKTMDKYLLFGHILQVRRIPDEQVNEKMWASTRGNKNGRVMPRNRIEGSRLRRGMEREGWEKRIENEETRRKQKSQKLKELGYEFEAPAVKKVSTVPVKSKTIEASEEAAKETEVATETTTLVNEEPAAVETVTKIVEKSPASVKTTIEKTVKRKTKSVDTQSTKKSKKAKTG